MRQRVHYKKHINRKRYDELHVSIEPKWERFEGFFEDMWESYESHVRTHGEKFTTLDRIDNLKGYSKENCHWTGTKEQARNRRSNVVFTLSGKKYVLSELVEKTPIPYSTVHARLSRGWNVAQTLLTPVGEPRCEADIRDLVERMK